VNRLAFVGLACWLAASAWASERTYAWQARLTDVAGTPVVGTHALQVSLYDAAGVAVWSKTFSAVPLEDGFASLALTGADDTSRDLDGVDLAAVATVGVAIDNGAELAPRQPLFDVPRATLAANATSGGGSGPPPAVPPTVSWATSFSGNGMCTLAKGVCTSAQTSGGAPASCAAILPSGSASCASDPSIDDAVTWVSLNETGDSFCATVDGACVQAVDGNGQSAACSSSQATGVASCRSVSVDVDGWDKGVTWTTTRSGDVACAYVGERCHHAWDASGLVQNCATSSGSGTAACAPLLPTSTWDFAVGWAGLSRMGAARCAAADGMCVEVHYVGPSNGTTGCTGGAGDANHQLVAKCRQRAPSDGWDRLATWTARQEVGAAQCALIGGVCTTVYYEGTSFGSATCTAGAGDANHALMALCRDLTPSDPFDGTATWEGRAAFGIAECAIQRNAECVDVFYAGPSAGAALCGNAAGDANHHLVARCKTATVAANGWDTAVNWTGVSDTGTARCAAISKTCVTSYRLSDGTFQACSTAISTGAVARCR
jgi:hypothetical protein